MKSIKLFFLVMLLGLCCLGMGCEQSEICSLKCGLEPDPGFCLAAFPKYYFDQEEGKCKQFTWGGCDGVVPFETLEECEACGCML